MPASRETPASAVGDLAALGQLWEAHRARLLAMLDRRIDPGLRRRVGAEAVLQSTFLDAARKWDAYRRSSPMQPYAWLYRLALDRLIEEYRTHARGNRDLSRDLPLDGDGSALLGGQLRAAGTGPQTAAQKAEQADRVRHVLGLLPAADRELLVMRYFDQLTTQEMCDILNARPDSPPVAEGALNVRLFRALKKLQKLWLTLYGGQESTP